MKEEKTKALSQIINSLPGEQSREVSLLLSDVINRMNIQYINWRDIRIYESSEKEIKAMLVTHSLEYIAALVKEAAKAVEKRMKNNKGKYDAIKVIVQRADTEEFFTVGNYEVLYGYILIPKCKMKKIEAKTISEED